MSNNEEELPETFEILKDEMEKVWKKEIIDAKDLLQTSQNLFQDNLLNYSINCLFIELLDFQIYLHDSNKFSEFFKNKDSDKKDFLFPLFPLYDENYIYRNGYISIGTFKSNVLSISQNRLHDKIIEFLDLNSSLEYYFWNVTFPHMFNEFICYENCKSAKNFLDRIEKYEQHFLHGASSFIRHNYLFQNTFMNLFFVYSQENGELSDHIKKVLIRSIDKLTIQQLQILNKLKETKERKEFIIKDIIIRSLKLWKYSSLYSTTKIIFNSEGENNLIETIEAKFFGETPEINIDDFLAPIFEKAKNEITSNSIYIASFMSTKPYLHAITFLDFLIIESIIKDAQRAIFLRQYYDNFNNRFFLREAITYAFIDDYISDLKVPYPQFVEPNVNQEIKQKWDEYVENCATQNKNPFEDVYDENKCNLIDKKFFKVGLKLAYHKYLFSKEMKNYLTQEDKMLIPLKLNFESMQNISQIYLNYFASKFQFNIENFVNETKDLYIDFFTKKIISLFESKLKKENKYKEIEFEKAVKEIIKISNDKLSEKFNSIFNSYNNMNKIIGEFNSIIFEINKKFPNFDSNIELTDKDVRSFELSLGILNCFTNSQIVTVYDQINPQIIVPEESFKIVNFDDFKDTNLKTFLFSGIFNYIKDTIVSLSQSDKIKLGQFFTFISEIKDMLQQFLSSQNIAFFETYFSLSNEKIIVKSIFAFSLKFVDPRIPGSVKDPQKLTNLLIALLYTAYDEINELVDVVPGLSELFENIKYMMYYLDVPVKKEGNGSLLLKLEKSTEKKDDELNSNENSNHDESDASENLAKDELNSKEDKDLN